MRSPACGASGAGSAAGADPGERGSAEARGDGATLGVARERGGAEAVMGEGSGEGDGEVAQARAGGDADGGRGNMAGERGERAAEAQCEAERGGGAGGGVETGGREEGETGPVREGEGERNGEGRGAGAGSRAEAEAEAEAGAEEDLSTIDPCHIIRLIRTLLEEAGGGDAEGRGGGGGAEGAEAVSEGGRGGRGTGGEGGVRGEAEEAGGVGMDEGGEAGAGEAGVRAGRGREGERGIAGGEVRENGLRGEGRSGGGGGGGGDDDDDGRGKEGAWEGEGGGAREGGEGRREEAGCVLWDLAASEEHAELMVRSHVLDVVLSVLASPSSPRLKEICMGLLANLACHVAPAHSMAAMGMGGSDSAAPSSMMHAVVGVLMGEDDPPCLTETCRLLGTVLRGAESEAWATFLAGSAPDCLPRVLWIAANTLHPQLLRKCTDLLLAMVDSSHPASRVLLPALLALPLLSTLADLIASEMDRLADGSRDDEDILDALLQVPEAISLAPGPPSALLAAHPHMLPLAVSVVASAPSHAVAAAAVTAAVLAANIIEDDPSLIPHLTAAPQFVPRLLGLLPLVSDDEGARTAAWSLLHALCSHALARGGEPAGREAGERRDGLVGEEEAERGMGDCPEGGQMERMQEDEGRGEGEVGGAEGQQQQARNAGMAESSDRMEGGGATVAAASVVVSAVVSEYERIVDDLQEHERQESSVCLGEGSGRDTSERGADTSARGGDRSERGDDAGERGGEEEKDGHVNGVEGRAGDADVDMGEAGMGVGEQRRDGGVNGGCAGAALGAHTQGHKATVLLLIRLLEQATSLPPPAPNHGGPSSMVAAAPQAQACELGMTGGKAIEGGMTGGKAIEGGMTGGKAIEGGMTGGKAIEGGMTGGKAIEGGMTGGKAIEGGMTGGKAIEGGMTGGNAIEGGMTGGKAIEGGMTGGKAIEGGMTGGKAIEGGMTGGKAIEGGMGGGDGGRGRNDG
ncbi:unnamed protein product [Closterium sp. Naga37s-1]|nr:unnamed protein product [Closterium sp. Naga37s-1]